MWRVKTLNPGLSPSPQPGKPSARTPLRELTLQPAAALADSGKGPPMCSSLTPSLCKLGLQEDNSNTSPMVFANAKKTNLLSGKFSHSSKCLEVCQHESDPIPETNSPLKISGKAIDQMDDCAVDPVDDCAVDPVDDCTINPVDDCAVDPVDGCAVDPVDDCTIDPVDDCAVDPMDDCTINPVDGCAVDPVDDCTINPVDDCAVDPVDDHVVYPMDDCIVDPVDGCTVDPVDDCAVDLVGDRAVDPMDAHIVDLVDDCIVNSVDDYVIYPVDDHVVEPVGDHTVDPMCDHADPMDGHAVDPAGDCAVDSVGGHAVESVDDCVVKTMILTPVPIGQQQDLTVEAHLDTIAEKSSSCLNESLRLGDMIRKGTSCTENSFSEVVSAMPEQPTFQNSPCHLLEYPPKLCSKQQLHCYKENLRNNSNECVLEDFLSSENNVLNSSIVWHSPSTALAVDFPVNHVDPGEEFVEHRLIQETEMNFSILSEEAELGDQVLVSKVEDVPSISLTPNPEKMESQEAPGPTVEDSSRIPGIDSETWMSPLAWLEKGVNTSVMLENLRQSLSLPSVLPDTAIGNNTPLSTCSVGTWFTPPAPQEENTNKSQTVNTKDSTSETEYLLMGRCPPDLTALSRHDLEDNLLSSLVMLEVLSRQLQAWKSQLTAPHSEVLDRSTQTDNCNRVTKNYHHLQESQEIRQALKQARNVMQSWMLVSEELISLFHLSLLHTEEDRVTLSQQSQHAETLASCCFDILKKLKTKLQSLKTEREEARHREEMALRGKDAAEIVLETFCAHASQRISQLEQDLTSMRNFRGLLQEAQTQLTGFYAEQEELAQQTVRLTSTLQQDWTSMQVDYGTWTALLNQSRQLSEKLTAKSKQALQERDAAIAEKQQVSKELEQASVHLKDCKCQIEQLNLENSRLATDLRAQLQILASMDIQLKELQSQHAHCAQDLAMKDELLCQLTQSNEEQAAQWQKEEMVLKHTQVELQHQQAVLAKEVQDLKETLEFADQESQVAHLELGQIECQLKTTLDVLRERSLQCENLKDTVENLKAELASTIAKHQEQALEKTHQHSHELWLLTEQLQSLTLFLQAKLKEKTESETVFPSTAYTPAQEHPPPSDNAFLGNMSTTVTDEEAESAPVPLLGSDKSAFTRVVTMVSLQPTETPCMEKSLAEMSAMLLELRSLCSLLQESKEEAIEALQRKICDLQTRLQTQEEGHQEAQKAKEADIEKLNQALCLRYKNEKELQEVIQKQNQKILEQIDRSGELISLREEVTQLTRLLRHAETETKVLQEALEGQLDSNCQLMATNWVQEKVCLSQEVDKLRAMFLEMKNEKAKLMVKYQSHRNILEENLRRSDTELKKLDDTVQHIYETLLSIPDVVKNCKELQGLLEFLS